MPILSNLKIDIPRLKVLKRLHYNIHKSRIHDKIDNLIDKLFEEAYILIETKTIYSDFEIKNKNPNKIKLVGTDFVIKGKEVCDLLKDSTKVTVMAVTLGEELPSKSRFYMEIGSPAEATILDAIGSETVEALAGKVNKIIDKNARQEGFTTTKRYSPGYSDWPIESQKGLLDLVGAEQIGIELNPRYLMIPEKSISAIVGWEK